MVDAPSTETICELVDAWILSQMPDPKDARAKAAAKATARTLATVLPPTIRHIYFQLDVDET